MHRSSRRLIQLETAPGRFAITQYDARGACPRRVSVCSSGKLPGLAGGVAVDEERGLLYIGATDAVLTARLHAVYVARLSSPCQTICRFPVTALGNTGQVTGVAYDACNDRIYVTNGTTIVEIDVTGDPARCAMRPGRTCRAAGVPLRGLDLQAGWTQKVIGKSCVQRVCPSCPNMVLTSVGGDPSLGSQTFGFELRNASPGIAGIWLNLGGCNSAGGNLFCGKWHVQPINVLGPLITNVTGGVNGSCAGSARWVDGVPAMAGLCGLKVCAQAITICRNARGQSVGLGVSNALEFTITP